MDTTQHLLDRIEKYIERSGTTATRFGSDCANNPSLVFRLRQGHDPRVSTVHRVHAWLDQKEAANADR